jgi:murein DD-endopeptidase
MKIKWDRLMENEKKQFEKMSESEKFIYFLLLQFGSPYEWGQETPEAADCSGAVCLALYAATGLLIRTTADDLLKRVFTRINPRQGEIRAVFYVTRKDKKHGDRWVAAGTATHIAGIVDDGVVMNSQEPSAKVRRINELSDSYQKEGHDVLIRGLNREALARLAAEGKSVYGLDAEFSRYFDLGA